MDENTNPPAQQQSPPGHTSAMRPDPADEMAGYAGRGLFSRGQHPEIAPSYVFFAAQQLPSYYTGEVLASIGGETLPG